MADVIVLANADERDLRQLAEYRAVGGYTQLEGVAVGRIQLHKAPDVDEGGARAAHASNIWRHVLEGSHRQPRRNRRPRHPNVPRSRRQPPERRTRLPPPARAGRIVEASGSGGERVQGWRWRSREVISARSGRNPKHEIRNKIVLRIYFRRSLSPIRWNPFLIRSCAASVGSST